MRLKILFPKAGAHGNLVWDPAQICGKAHLLDASLIAIRRVGYWASPFPEGDGIAFAWTAGERGHDIMLREFKLAFAWLDLAADSTEGDLGKTEYDVDLDVLCTVMVPLAKVKIEDSFELGRFQFVCAKFFDPQPENRLCDYESEYLQFDMTMRYGSLARARQAIDGSDAVIKQCLSYAERAMDVIRYQSSSFARPEFTPNPAGQMSDGFYSATLFPRGVDLTPMKLEGIALPIGASNNWLGPELDNKLVRGQFLLIDILNGRKDELSLLIKGALRSCRHSFYALGDESKFLNLVFALDGLLHPGELRGWKHRTYVAAILSAGNPERFGTVLEQYDYLYTDVRNKLVHGGKDFYELNVEPTQACEVVHNYIKDVIRYVEANAFETVGELRNVARNFLLTPVFMGKYTSVISKVDAMRGKISRPLTWT